MYGHDGLMGSNGPIGVGACFATKKPTIIFLVTPLQRRTMSLERWAGHQELPIVFIIEDNNLSILTEKRVRKMEIDDVAKSFKMESYSISDSPKDIFKVSKIFQKINFVTLTLTDYFGMLGLVKMIQKLLID